MNKNLFAKLSDNWSPTSCSLIETFIAFIIVNMNLIFCNFRNLECQFDRFPRSSSCSFSGFLSSPHSTRLSPIASDFYFAFNFHVSSFTLTLAINVVRPVGVIMLDKCRNRYQKKMSSHLHAISTSRADEQKLLYINAKDGCPERFGYKANWLITCLDHKRWLRFDYDTGVKQ